MQTVGPQYCAPSNICLAFKLYSEALCAASNNSRNSHSIQSKISSFVPLCRVYVTLQLPAAISCIEHRASSSYAVKWHEFGFRARHALCFWCEILCVGRSLVWFAKRLMMTASLGETKRTSRRMFNGKYDWKLNFSVFAIYLIYGARRQVRITNRWECAV